MDKVETRNDAPDFARLYLGGGPRLLDDPEAHLRAIEGWARGLGGDFPPANTSPVCATFSLPADQRLVDPITTTEFVRRRCAQALLDGADALRRARPAGREHQRVAAMLLYPDLFMSEVQVFLDPTYYRGFESRSGQQVWTRLPPERSLACELSLSVPEGFVQRGWLNTILEDEAADQVFYQCEVWMIGEAVG